VKLTTHRHPSKVEDKKTWLYFPCLQFALYRIVRFEQEEAQALHTAIHVTADTLDACALMIGPYSDTRHCRHTGRMRTDDRQTTESY
jgi:hypothetical protein